MKKVIIFNAIFIALIILVGLLSSCKTRQSQLQTSKVIKQTTTTQETGVHSTDSVKVVDKSTQTKTIHSAALDSSKSTTEVEADSIVVTKKPGQSIKTVIYPKKGTKVNFTNTDVSSQKNDSIDSLVKNIITQNTKHLDSIAKQSKTENLDSTGKKKTPKQQEAAQLWQSGSR
jgi:FtsZ-interacting cell division protein ZipA